MVNFSNLNSAKWKENQLQSKFGPQMLPEFVNRIPQSSTPPTFQAYQLVLHIRTYSKKLNAEDIQDAFNA